jgi:hypothetical protein
MQGKRWGGVQGMLVWELTKQVFPYSLSGNRGPGLVFSKRAMFSSMKFAKLSIESVRRTLIYCLSVRELYNPSRGSVIVMSGLLGKPYQNVSSFSNAPVGRIRSIADDIFRLREQRMDDGDFCCSVLSEGVRYNSMDVSRVHLE